MERREKESGRRQREGRNKGWKNAKETVRKEETKRQDRKIGLQRIEKTRRDGKTR